MMRMLSRNVLEHLSIAKLAQVHLQSSKCMKFDFLAACICMSTAATAVLTVKPVAKGAASL